MQSEHTGLVMREFIGLLAEYAKLMQDPKAFQALVKEAVTINEREQKRADDAAALIKSADALKADLAQRQRAADSVMAEAQQLQKDNFSERGHLNEINAAQEKRNTVLSAREYDVDLRDKALAAREAQVEASKADTAKERERLAEWEKSIRENSLTLERQQSELRSLMDTQGATSASLQRSLEEKTRSVDETRRQLKSRETAVAEREADMAAKQNEFENMHRALKKANVLIQQLGGKPEAVDS